MTFLLGNGSAEPWSHADQWEKMTAEERASVKEEYGEHNIKLLVSALGSAEAPATAGVDAKELATQMAEWVKKYDVDGLDLDFEVRRLVYSLLCSDRDTNCCAGYGGDGQRPR